LKEGKADAALAASIFHYKKYSINQVKKYLKSKGIGVRL
jgi:imidazole glycerol-phosphate synthase subunit HisF